MILFTAAAIKILVFILTLVVGYRIFSKRLDKKQLIFFSILVMIFACCANYMSNLLPPLTDTITLTALGEKQEEAKGMEVYLNGYTIDGEEYLAGKSLDIESGHWFWSGETYAWRPETDSRQPAGVSREVVLNIPVGWDRTLNFSSNEWRGLVQIDDGYNVWVEDTYADKGSVKVVQIAKSETGVLLANQVRYVAVYAAIMLLTVFGIILLNNKVLHNEPEIKEWLNRNNSKFIYAGIAFVTLLVMSYYADRTSFWSDELAQIGFVNGTFGDVIDHCLKMHECSPPLALILSWIWYNIAPYGEGWLLLFDIFLSACSIYLMGLIGEKTVGKYCGLLAAIFMATSATVWLHVAYEFRAYSCLLFFSTLTLFVYIKRNENKNQKKWTIWFGLSMAALAMTHYFGMIACACYFIADFYLWLKKRINIKTIISYCIVGLPVCIWLTACLSLAVSVFGGSSWFPVPKWTNVQSLMQFMSGNYELTYAILILGIASSLVYLFSAKPNKFNWISFYQVFSGLSIIFSIGVLIIYGNFINSRVTLWTNRYFIFLLPQIYLVSALVINDMVSFINLEKREVANRIVCLFFALLLSLNCLVIVSNNKSSQPYREAADWIYTQVNYIFNEDTLILTTTARVEGWDEYYITRGGRRDSLNVFTTYALTEEEVENYEISLEDVLKYNRVYIQYSHSNISSALQNILNENYKLETEKKDIQVKVYVHK